MHRVVLDTNVFVRALLDPECAIGPLVFSRADLFEIVMSEEMALELLLTLRRPELMAKFPRLMDIGRRQLAELLVDGQMEKEIDPDGEAEDADGSIFVATARVGGADYLVTEDRKLLAIGDTDLFSPVTMRQFLRVAERGR